MAESQSVVLKAVSRGLSIPWSTSVAILQAARPKQWTKNFILFVPIIFAGKMTNPHLLFLTFISVIAFCLGSSAIYLLNDVIDREKDRLHPRKCKRPIASGRLSATTALLVAGFFAVTALLLALCVKASVALILGVYLGIMLTYSYLLKDIVIIDIMTIAVGFVLRAIAGGLASACPVSGWFLLCTSFGATFLAVEKRRHELHSLSDSDQHRKVLAHYSKEFIDRIERIVIPGMLFCYISYAFLSYHGQWMLLAVPFVVYGVIRYEWLALNGNLTGSPEEVLLQDKPIQISVILWLLTSMGVLYNLIPTWAEAMLRFLENFGGIL
jgi:4-hydroxybenzoate polyprenyltransferase